MPRALTLSEKTIIQDVATAFPSDQVRAVTHSMVRPDGCTVEALCIAVGRESVPVHVERERIALSLDPEVFADSVMRELESQGLRSR